MQKIIKNNLACHLMLKAKEMHITMKFTTSDLNIDDNDSKIVDLLDNNYTKNIAISLRKLNLVHTN